MMSYQFLLVEQIENTYVITINRPDQMNALNKQTIQELHDAFEFASKEDTIRAIVLTGSGDKAFVAGADIKEFANFNVEQGKSLSKVGHDLLFNFIEKLEKPVIAAVNGYAFGGGLELAMSCHIRLVSENAVVGLPEVSLGVIPGYGGTQRLARLIGRGKATEMVVSAGRLAAQESVQWGLMNNMYPIENLLSEAMALAAKIAKQSPTAIAAALRAIHAGFQHEQIGLNHEIEEFGYCFGTADFKEGTSAFIEKRKPVFTGK
jgi:enoyl-CoA hydratase